MDSKPREFIDKKHPVMEEYYELIDRYGESNPKSLKTQVRKLIEQDPDFLDPYIILFEILQDEGKIQEAEKILNRAYKRAIKLITDSEGNWPDIIEWGYLENRHIIRTLLNKALLLWQKGKNEEGLVILRKLLRTNPTDNIGARDFILAIRMGMTYKEFENRFNKGGYYDIEIDEWFNENYIKYPDEFSWWEKAVSFEE